MHRTFVLPWNLVPLQPTRENDGPLRWLAALTCIVSLASLLLQYVILIRATLDTVGPAFATVRFFSYFTILSNVLVVLVTSTAVATTKAHAAHFFARGDVRGAVALYIGVTGAIYFTILRHLWQPQGAQWWADTGLHYATPLLYLAWWVLGASHGAVQWRDVAALAAVPAGLSAVEFRARRLGARVSVSLHRRRRAGLALGAT